MAIIKSSQFKYRGDISNFIENIAVNGNETNSIVTFAENANDSISTGNAHPNPQEPRGSAPCRLHRKYPRSPS